MRAYVCFDDTDVPDAPRGTGQLARLFEEGAPDGCSVLAVVRQQFPLNDDIPYTSHNSSACVVLEVADATSRPSLIEAAITHVEKYAYEGSDPGVCVAFETDEALESTLLTFAHRAQIETVTKEDAITAACDGIHLSGHGGTNEGIIGAAAGVALTHWGWIGRFLEYTPARLRSFVSPVPVSEVTERGIMVIPIDRNVVVPKPSDTIAFKKWLRPLLVGSRPCVMVAKTGEGTWEALSRVTPLKEGKR